MKWNRFTGEFGSCPSERWTLSHEGHSHDVPHIGGGGAARCIKRRAIEMVEGYMGFDIAIEDSGASCSKLVVHEPERGFEDMVIGKSCEEVPFIVSRICGVCPFPYAFAAVKAAEAASGRGVEITPQAKLLRKLALYGNLFSSHILHPLDLVIPRLAGLPSIIPFAKANPDAARRAIGLHKLGNDISKLFGGRDVHSITIVPGGMSNVPKEAVVRALREQLLAAKDDLRFLIGLYQSLAAKFPAWLPERKREFISILSDEPSTYEFYDSGIIYSTENGQMNAADFKNYHEEYRVPHSNAKFVRTKRRRSYMVGSLARLNNNRCRMSSFAKEAAATLGLTAFPCFDPRLNTAAQLVEAAQILDDAPRVIEELLTRGINENEKPVPVVPRTAYAAGFLEAPRGMIWHEYEFDGKGLIARANCMIPTGMNCGSMQEDLEVRVPHLLKEGATDEEIANDADLLLAHYDPCNSCAVHAMQVRRNGGTTHPGENPRRRIW